MKVRTLRQFKDKNTGKLHKVGDEFVVNKARYAEILQVGELIEEIKEEKNAEE